MAIFVLPYDQTIVKPIVVSTRIEVYQKKHDVNVITRLKEILGKLVPSRISEARSNKKGNNSPYEISTLSGVLREILKIDSIHTYMLREQPLPKVINEAKKKSEKVQVLRELLQSLGMAYE